MTPLKTIAENGRGLANTVLLIRVPYDGPAGLTPWMAGGGSTVRSVPDKDSLAPFLSTDSKGEQGTFVLMADGSVRFLKKGISDEVFKAICTVDSPTPAGWKFDEDYPALKPPKEPAPPPLVAGAVPPGSGSSAPVKKGPPPGPKGAPAGWQEYTNEEGGFTVSMPAGAAPSSDPNPAGGAIVGFRFANPATQSLFQAGFQNLPASEKLSPEQLAQGIPEQIFDELKKGVLSSMPGFEASSEKPISLGKYQGREYLLVGDAPPPKAPIGKGPVGKGAAPKGKATKGAPGKAAAGRLSVYARFLIGQDRFYILVATTPGLTPDSPEYSAFFDSFKLTAK